MAQLNGEPLQRATKSARIETSRVENFSLAVDFKLFQDRYARVIQLVESDMGRPLLCSVEGTPDEEWPPSPVLQQLHLEHRPHAEKMRDVALLVGMAGRNHWSLSVETSSPAALIFDVACRVDASRSADLRSTYRFAVPPTKVEKDHCWWALDRNWRAVFRAEIPASSIQFQESGVAVMPTETTGMTRRWKYQIAIQSVG